MKIDALAWVDVVDVVVRGACAREYEGWQIGQSEQVIEMPGYFAVPASGTVECAYRTRFV